MTAPLYAFRLLIAGKMWQSAASATDYLALHVFLGDWDLTEGDGDEPNQREEVVFIPVSIGNPLCDLYHVVKAFKLAC